jgi:flavin reductase (DIM6/NTAB) family NADH-FMN oxidoreductase RutF
MDPNVFDELVGELEYPMFIVTTRAGDDLAGCLIGFASQTSIHPRRFLTCLSHRNRTYRVARDASVLAVHLVPRRAEALAELFGGHTGDEIDKFARCRWTPGPEGVPVLADCPNWFAGRILERFDLGDHEGFLLDPIAGRRGDDAPEYDFQQAKHIRAGHPA